MIKEKHAFRYRGKTIYINLEDIKIKRGKLKSSDLKIHDAYVDQYDNLLLLVDYGEELATNSEGCHFWISSKQISASKIESYSDQMNKFVDTNNPEKLLCNTTKLYTLPCNKKTRTVGIFLACYTCGLIASYKVKKRQYLIYLLIEICLPAY